MATQTVDIEFRAKLANLKAELASIDGLTKKQTREIAGDWQRAWRSAEKSGTTALDKVAKQAGTLAKVGSIIGGPLGGALATIGDSSEIATDGLSGVAAGIAGVGVAGAAIAAVAAATVGMGMAAFGAVRGFEASASALGEHDSVVQANEAAIRSAMGAVSTMDASMMRLGVTLTGVVAPAVEEVAFAFVGMAEAAASTISTLADADTGFAKMTGGISAADLAIGAITAGTVALFPPLAAMMDVTDSAGVVLGDFAEQGREAAASLDEASRAAASASVWIGRLGDERRAEERAMLQTLGIIESDSAARDREADAARRQADALREAQKASAAATRETRASVTEAERAAEAKAATIAQLQIEARSYDAARVAVFNYNVAVGAAGATAVEATMSATTAAKIAGMAAAEEHARDLARVAELNDAKASADEQDRARKEASLAMAATQLNATSSLVSTIGQLYDQLTDNQIDNMRDGSEEQKKALKKQFAAHKAFALVTAGINTAAAVIGMLANPGGVAGIALAAVAAATGIAQIAIIAAQKSNFHVGGLVAPDEVDARLTSTEGVLTSTGVASVGGEEGLRDLNRGRGAAPSGGGGMMALVVDGRLVDAMWTGVSRGRDGLMARVSAHMSGGMLGREPGYGT